MIRNCDPTPEAIRASLAALTPGESVDLRFPDTPIVGRELYASVNNIARSLFGSGNFRVSKPPGAGTVWIWRKAP